jgi:hypothetical protein
VKTGRAVAVVVGGTHRRPEVLLRRDIALWDPDVPESAQPFHAGLGLAPADARPIVDRASDAVHRASQRSLAGLVEELSARGVALVGAALVRSSATDPDTIHNPHMHAHAAEGRLFHDALAEAARRARLRAHSVLGSDVARDAARELGVRAPSLERTLAELGKRMGPPWRADEKTACAAALLALSWGRPVRSRA